jgi:hypothetical protein
MWDVKTARYLKKKPGRPFALFLAGWAVLLWGDPILAGRYFDDALAADGGYTPAYAGRIAREVATGNISRAAILLSKYADKLNLSGYINRFRLGSAISACALRNINNNAKGSGSGRRFLSGFRNISADRTMLKLRTEAATRNGAATDAGVALIQFFSLLRYLELLRRAKTRAAERNAAERMRLADGICAMPGLLDEFRLMAIKDAGRNAEGHDFTFDNPAIFTKTLLNNLFREKILNGELREPRIILSNLRRDSNIRGVDNINKWLFLKLSHTMRYLCGHQAENAGKLETETACELEREGWWADPVVRDFLLIQVFPGGNRYE